MNCWVVPATIEGLAGLTAIETRFAAVPVPVSETSCGLPVALSLNVSVPVRVFSCLGEKVTEAVQLAPAFNDEGHVLVTEKSFGLAVILVIFSFVD
jgi:hypothetical protein